MVLPVAQSTAQDSQMRLLQYQMQQFLDRLDPLRPERFEVRIDRATLVRSQSLPRESQSLPRESQSLPKESHPSTQTASVPAESLTDSLDETRVTIFVLERIEVGSEPTIRWVIDVASDASTLSAEPLASLSTRRAQICARLAIADYWQLMPAQSALKTYHSPSPSGYQQHRLWHVGEQVSPTAIPEMTLRLQEPLPLYFLTRTLKGPRTYASRALPLQVCAIGEGET